MERHTVRAPSDGAILQLNVRLGQFAALVWNEPMIVLGDVERLHVRVDVDENDLPYFTPGADAVATLKNRAQIRFPLVFVAVDPFVIPKQNLTGSNTERVDTRVLQVIYRLPDDRPIDTYVGQQMDVYIKAAEPSRGLALDLENNPAIPFVEPTRCATVAGGPGRDGRDSIVSAAKPDEASESASTTLRP
jgi:hypothetical protein